MNNAYCAEVAYIKHTYTNILYRRIKIKYTKINWKPDNNVYRGPQHIILMQMNGASRNLMSYFCSHTDIIKCHSW